MVSRHCNLLCFVVLQHAALAFENACGNQPPMQAPTKDHESDETSFLQNLIRKPTPDFASDGMGAEAEDQEQKLIAFNEFGKKINDAMKEASENALKNLQKFCAFTDKADGRVNVRKFKVDAAKCTVAAKGKKTRTLCQAECLKTSACFGIEHEKDAKSDDSKDCILLLGRGITSGKFPIEADIVDADKTSTACSTNTGAAARVVYKLICTPTLANINTALKAVASEDIAGWGSAMKSKGWKNSEGDAITSLVGTDKFGGAWKLGSPRFEDGAFKFQVFGVDYDTLYVKKDGKELNTAPRDELIKKIVAFVGAKLTGEKALKPDDVTLSKAR